MAQPGVPGRTAPRPPTMPPAAPRSPAARKPRATATRRVATDAAEHKNHAIYFVPGLRRGLIVLETLANEGRPMSVAEIGKRIGLTRSSMFRLAYTLQHMGFVEEVPDTKMLKLGARVLNIGYAYLASQTLIETARPELEALARPHQRVVAPRDPRPPRDPLSLVHPDPVRASSRP